MKEWDRIKMRMEVLRDIERIIAAGAILSNERDPRGQHVFVLNNYQIANLKELIAASGYASVYKSPLNVFHNGDWVGELHWMLSTVDTSDTKPNVNAEVLTKLANEWTAP